MASETKPEPTDEERADQMAAQIREKEREREDALVKRIRHEAATYATCFEEMRRRLEPYTQWDWRPKMEGDADHVPPLLTGSDIKDAATSLFIQIARGISWNR